MWVGLKTGSLLVNQSGFQMELQWRWVAPSPLVSPHPQLHGFNSSLNSSGASFQTSPAPPTPNNSLSYRKGRWGEVGQPEGEERNSGRSKGGQSRMERKRETRGQVRRWGTARNGGEHSPGSTAHTTPEDDPFTSMIQSLPLLSSWH